MSSLIPRRAWARRLAYELIYAWPGGRARTFNVGLAPARPDISGDPMFAGEFSQIELYAELFDLAAMDAAAWRRIAVLEVAAGCGGGLLYLRKRHQPRRAVGVDASIVAVWRGRRLGVDLRRADAMHLPFEDGSFECVICVDALNYFVEADFSREVRRVLTPAGQLLLAENSKTWAKSHERLQRLARLGGFHIEKVRDVSEGVRRSIREREQSLPRFLSCLPTFLLKRVRETLMFEGSDRYRQWQAGEQCFTIAVLRRSPPEQT